MKQPLRIGIIGAGANTRLRHIPGFQEIEGVSVDAVANRSFASSKKVADEFSIPCVAKSWRQIVGDPAIDAVCIGTWPYMHAEITIAALRAGKHVLTEARMASSLGEAERMLAAGNEHPELVKQIVPSPFTLRVDATVMQLLESGAIGKIREILVEHSHGALVDAQQPLSWRQDPQYSGINMLTMGIYHEVIYRWLRVEAEELRAQGLIHIKERKHWETGQMASVKLPDSLYIQGSFRSAIGFQYRFSGIDQGGGRNEIRLIGESGSLRLDVGAEKLYLGRGSREELVEIDLASATGWAVEADFVNSIRKGAPVRLTSFEDGVAYMRFTQRVWNALKT